MTFTDQIAAWRKTSPLKQANDCADEAEALLKELKLIRDRVPHKRHRTGLKKSRPGTYVQFNYACNDDCPACALTVLIGDRPQGSD